MYRHMLTMVASVALLAGCNAGMGVDVLSGARGGKDKGTIHAGIRVKTGYGLAVHPDFPKDYWELYVLNEFGFDASMNDCPRTPQAMSLEWDALTEKLAGSLEVAEGCDVPSDWRVDSAMVDSLSLDPDGTFKNFSGYGLIANDRLALKCDNLDCDIIFAPASGSEVSTSAPAQMDAFPLDEMEVGLSVVDGSGCDLTGGPNTNGYNVEFDFDNGNRDMTVTLYLLNATSVETANGNTYETGQFPTMAENGMGDLVSSAYKWVYDVGSWSATGAWTQSFSVEFSNGTVDGLLCQMELTVYGPEYDPG